MAKRLLDADPRREQRRQERLMQAIERQFEGRLANEIARAMRDAVEQWAQTSAIPTMNDHRNAVQSVVFTMAMQSVKVFGARILAQQRANALVIERKDFESTLTKLATRYIQQESVRKHITSISDTTRAQIVDAVERGLAEGLGTDATARLIREAVPLMSRTRAALISRTETHSAANYGADAAARETGLQLQKEWVASQDERTREDHSAADGQIVNMDEAFTVGGESLMYPGDPGGSAEQIINCRCVASHIVIDV